jgi:chromosomal replication initiation ATPase DnaA
MYREQVFVSRERELDRLNGWLERALGSESSVCFVAGEAGAGKTALLSEFARRAQASDPNLIVAFGDANARLESVIPTSPSGRCSPCSQGMSMAGSRRGD